MQETLNPVKNISNILFAILFLTVGVLAFFVFRGPREPGSGTSSDSNSKETKVDLSKVDLSKLPEGKIAYVDLDSINMNYDFIKEKANALRVRGENLSGQYDKMVMEFQTEYQRFQESAQAGIATQSQLEQKQMELQRMQGQIAEKENELKRLEMDRDKANADMQTRVYAFIEKYNEKYNYDFILTKSSLIITMAYANPKYDITQAVVQGLNEEYRATKSQKK